MENIYSKVFIVFFLETLGYSGFLQDFYSFIDHSFITGYFHLILNHIEKNTEIAMPDMFQLSISLWQLLDISNETEKIVIGDSSYSITWPYSIFFFLTSISSDLTFSYPMSITYACKKCQRTSLQKGSHRDSVN